MFGAKSGWGQQNNQQQQGQQQGQQGQGGGLFGGTGGFGQQSTGFGQQNTNTGGFGQPQQQNTGGGLFGGGNTTNTGFGGFGSTAQQSTNTFGAARPTFGAAGASTFGGNTNTGGGLFGSTNNNTSTFAQPANSGGLFGKPATTGTFGAGTSSNLFGAKPATTGFGITGASNPNQVHPYNATTLPNPPTTGTSQPAYYPTWQQDPSATGSTASTSAPHLFNSISAMNEYKGASWEELRLMDYQQGRKDAGAKPAQGGFGQPAAGGFGQPATNTFGQPAATTSTFGAPKPGGLFGTTPAAGGFGATATGGFGTTPAATGGLFGQPQQQQSTGLFGQNNTGTTGGLFGQNNQQQNPPASGGLFGQNNTFGQAQNQPQNTNTFSFGAPKPASPFGATTGGFGQQPAAATNTFGQPATNTTTPGFSFGNNNNQQPQQPATGGLFGGGFGTNNQTNTTGVSPFGQADQNQQQAQPAAGGLFGNTASKPGGLFGANSATAGPSNTFSFGLNNNTTTQPAASNPFGTTNNAAPAASTSLFGQPQAQQQNQQPAASGGLFNGNAGGGLFGTNKPAATAPTNGLFNGGQAAQPAQPNSLFSSTGATTGMFGLNNNALGQNNQQNQNQPTGGLFNGTGGIFNLSNQQQPQQPPANGGLFGSLNQPQQQTSSFFGNTGQQQPQQNLGTSLFGGSLGSSTAAQVGYQQPSLTASIDQNPYGRNELFQYSGQQLQLGSTSKKPALPPLTSSSFRITPSSKSQLGKLRGFASPLASSTASGRSASPLGGLASPGRSSFLNSPSATHRYKGLTDAALTPNAFVPRPNIKKLNLTPTSNGAVNGGDKLESVLGKSALKSSTSTAQPTPERNQLSRQTSQQPTPGTMLFNPPANGNRQHAEGSDSPLRRNGTPLDTSQRVSGSERQPKRGEYWCKPKLEKLRQLGERDLREMHNFTAGRRGYGEVTFEQAVDLTGLPLSDFLGTVIVFTDMELSVYPDDFKDKPPRGQGLNVPARITLENCYSKDKATKQPITDTDDPRHARFLKRLKAIPETEFVSYVDGIWTFEVEHFSKYGVGDSDEESEGDVQTQPKSAKEREAISRRSERSGTEEEEDEDILPPTKSRHDEDMDSEEHDSGAEEDEEMNEDEQDEASSLESPSTSPERDGFDLPPKVPDNNWDKPLKSKIGQEGMRKLREMQNSFFGDRKPRSAAPRDINSIERKKMEAKRLLETYAGFDVPEGEGLPDRAVKRTSFGETPVSPPKLRQPRKYARIALEESIVNGAEGVRADAGLAMGRSFRCSWGPNGELVHFGKICAPGTTSTSSADATVIIEKVELLADEPKIERANADRLLSLHLANSQIDTFDDIPYAIISSDIRFSDFAKLFDAGDRSHEANIWRLGVALFDEIDLGLPDDSSEDLIQRIDEIRRKLALSKWLENAVAPAVDADLIKTSDDQPGKLFTLLSGNQVDRAVQAALDGNDMRLATLISQIGGPELFKQEVQRQLDDWTKYKTNSHIASGYRRLYALLAGITDVSKGESGRGIDHAPDVRVAEGLDWKRAFGLHLWYGCPFEHTIGDLLESFNLALSSATPPAKPIPPYLEKPTPLHQSWKMRSQPTDILYGLVRLFADITIPLESVLRTRDVSPSPLDMRLSWHLYLLLSRVLAKRDFEDREEGYSANADLLTSGYAWQLELGGEWRWTAFVLLHLETSEGREKALKALLHRHPDPSADDETFLINTLQIPQTWLHQARAAQLSLAGDAFGEYHALIHAESYNAAQRILISKLAPEAILREDMELLRTLCEALEGKGADGWEYGGKLFLDYIHIKQDVPNLLKSIAESGGSPDPHQSCTLSELARTLPRVLSLLPALFPDKEDVQQVASLSDMLSELHGLAGTLHLAKYIARPAISPLMVDVDRLHLLQDKAFHEFEKSLVAVAAV